VPSIDRNPCRSITCGTIVAAVGLILALCPLPAHAQSFRNWETPHVHPLDITPDGTKLLAVNTADNRLEVFDITSGTPTPLGNVPVGLDPVSVRARTSTEAWVVSHISDSVNIVNLTTMNVVATLRTDDEPCDVVFAGAPIKAYVSCSQANTVMTFDPTNLAAAPGRINIVGEDPRMMAVNAAGTEVYIAIFQSGNRSTILGGGSTMGGGFPPNVVTNPAGPYGGVNPPPNDGLNFKPPQAPGNPAPPAVGLIVKKNPLNAWMDDNNHDWTSLVSGANASLSGRPTGWDLWDHDVAIIDTATQNVRYATGLMNICMAMAVNPGSGEINVVGTDATNEVRFEPVLEGRFIRVNFARVNPVAPTTLGVVDLNPHLTYGTTIPFVSIPQVDRNKSVGDPRGLVWNASGTRGYVTGMGSNCVVVIDGAGARAGLTPTIPVGEGPTGAVLGNDGRLYVLNKFEGSISVVDTATETESTRVFFYDPTPAPILIGRKHLYDTHRNSGLGHIACASCHVDARMDFLAWDLGDPSGSVKTFNQNCNAGAAGGCEDFHPMKGPMTTQTLQDIIGKEPHHWRGDRDGLEEFAGAFVGLQGDDAPLPPAEMQEFENFLATIQFPPNPYRNFDNTLPTNLPLPGFFTTSRFGAAGLPMPNGNAQSGLTTYRTTNIDGGLRCVSCHTLPTGAGSDMTLNGFTLVPIPPGPNGERHLMCVNVDGSTNVSIKVPHVRNAYEKTGFDTSQVRNTAGFGYLHDGSVDTIVQFISEPVFSVTSNQQVANLTAFMLAFGGSELPAGSPLNPLEPPGVLSLDTHAAVGWQTTLVSAATAPAAQLTLISNMITQANTNKVGLVVKGRQGGIMRGWRYNGANVFQSDRTGETITAAVLQAAAGVGGELTYTVVYAGGQTRIGIDRDLDGAFDRDELDACSDPADPASKPGDKGDLDGSGTVTTADMPLFVGVLMGTNLNATQIKRSDLNCDFVANGQDVQGFARKVVGP